LKSVSRIGRSAGYLTGNEGDDTNVDE